MSDHHSYDHDHHSWNHNNDHQYGGSPPPHSPAKLWEFGTLLVYGSGAGGALSTFCLLDGAGRKSHMHLLVDRVRTGVLRGARGAAKPVGGCRDDPLMWRRCSALALPLSPIGGQEERSAHSVARLWQGRGDHMLALPWTRISACSVSALAGRGD